MKTLKLERGTWRRRVERFFFKSVPIAVNRHHDQGIMYEGTKENRSRSLAGSQIVHIKKNK